MAPDGVKEKKKKVVTATMTMSRYTLRFALAINSLCDGDDIERTRKNLFVANFWHDSTYTSYACHIKKKKERK